MDVILLLLAVVFVLLSSVAFGTALVIMLSAIVFGPNDLEYLSDDEQ